MTVPGADKTGTVLRDWLLAEAAVPFQGWDFSYLTGRMLEDAPPWDYRAIVTAALPAATALLDLGTGGGEFLASLAPLPPQTWATEGYPPNVPVAQARLAPLGVTVVQVGVADAAPLPFAASSFDLIINRHEAYDVAELWRVLRPGGTFVTQQVGGSYGEDLRRFLGAPEPRSRYHFWTLASAQQQLADAGFSVQQAAEAFPALRFTDAGAVAYYLSAVPWELPDFSVERYWPRLAALQQQCVVAGSFATQMHYFVLVATKPATPGAGCLD